jgi:lipopolysaccharide export LptBFGC system permease protein LptF
MLAVVVLFAYYLIMAATNALGKNGAIWPPLAAWVPNLLIGGTGLLLLILEER